MHAKYIARRDGQRAELKNSLDDFPTPPWATRALIEHVVVGKSVLISILEGVGREWEWGRERQRAWTLTGR
jgi:hypothetical protein